jgi:hypothetical protein
MVIILSIALPLHMWLDSKFHLVMLFVDCGIKIAGMSEVGIRGLHPSKIEVGWAGVDQTFQTVTRPYFGRVLGTGRVKVKAYYPVNYP